MSTSSMRGSMAAARPHDAGALSDFLGTLRAMSIYLVTLVRKTSDQVGVTFDLQVMYADVANDSGQSIYCGIDYVHKMIRRDRRTAQRGTRILEDMNWLQLVGNEFGGRELETGKGLARIYRINPDWIDLANAHMATITRGMHVKVLPWAEGRRGVHRRAALDAEKGGTTPPQQSLTLIKATKLVDEPKNDSSTSQRVLCSECEERPAVLNRPGTSIRVCYRCWKDDDHAVAL
jgi:hypothetical protein